MAWLSSDYYWVVGVLLASLASFISNLGLNLQKLQHRRLKQANATPEEAAKYHTYALWRVGFGLVIFGSVADMMALSFSAQSLIAPLASLTLVSNIIFAPILLGERIGWKEYVATVLILSGSVVSVIFATHEDVTMTITQLFSAYLRVPFATYASLTATYIVVVYMFVAQMERIEAVDGANAPTYTRYERLLRFAYPSLAGTAGAQSVLFAKCTIELISNSTSDGAMFLHYQTYIVVFCLLFSVYLQIYWLNEGLKRFQIAFIVPIFTAFWIIISVTAGMIYYDEYLGMSYESLGLFILGVFITIMGVVLLATRDYVREEVTANPDLLRSIIPSNTNGDKHSGSGAAAASDDTTTDESRPLLYGSNGTTNQPPAPAPASSASSTV